MRNFFTSNKSIFELQKIVFKEGQRRDANGSLFVRSGDLAQVHLLYASQKGRLETKLLLLLLLTIKESATVVSFYS